MGTVARSLTTLALALVPGVCAARSCDDVVFLDIEAFPYLPLYFVDRRRQTSRLLFGTPREVSLIRAYQEQRCGLLLFTTLMDPARLFDLQTGEMVRLLPSDEAVWVRRPRD